VAVARSLRRRGIGQRLIEAGLNALRRLGGCGCVVVGDPA
jgi:predicted N-acetyltransferase YhbS